MNNYIIAAFTFMQLCTTYAHADIGLQWDPNPETNVTYKAYMSVKPGAITNYIHSVNAGTNVTVRIPTAPAGEASFYVVTAQRDGLESDPSEEIIFVIPLIDKKITPIGLIIRFKAIPTNGNLEYILESSSDLFLWEDARRFITYTAMQPDGTELQEAYVPYAKPKEFFRVRVLIK